MDRIQMAYDVYEPEDQKCQKKVPILLLHGHSWNKFVYRHVAQMLCKETGRKVWAVDARNHGETVDCDVMTYDLLVQDVVDFMEDQKIQKTHMVCHSSSAVAAHETALRRPDLVGKIVMVDHIPYELDEEFYRKAYVKYSRYQNQFLRILSSDLSLKEARDKVIAFAPAEKKGVVALHEKIAYDLTKLGGVFTWRRPLDSQTVDSALYSSMAQGRPRQHYDGEILVIRGENSDFVTDTAFEDALKYNPNMRLVTIKDSTHVLMFEKMEEFVCEVMKFLESDSTEEDI